MIIWANRNSKGEQMSLEEYREVLKVQNLQVYQMNKNLGLSLIKDGDMENGKNYLLIARECRRCFKIYQTF